MPATYRHCPALAVHHQHGFAFKARLLTHEGGEALQSFLIFFPAAMQADEIARARVVLANLGEMSAFQNEDRLDLFIAGQMSGAIESYTLLRLGARPLPKWAADAWPDWREAAIEPATV